MSDADPTLRPDGRPMDRVDREKLPVARKLELACHEFRKRTGVDPRGGGACFVGRPRCVLQLLIDAPPDELRLERMVVLGNTRESDVVAYWNGVPIRLRCCVTSNDLHVVLCSEIPWSKPDDRRLAGALRVQAHLAQREGRRLDVEEVTKVLP